ncbi:hypothetical protein FNF31_01855 [Cafeteria roenbergensis]|uniref:Pseudouridine synthase RsuA/RluA-like domain-containing protein n=1 Tax=Cafeteria roenbergensis TaxID=33653 RepID=A0A5A8DNI3_CAFRO|nr:hypothetical protein FNF31_01855 [Cafeteria roenbergensis]KAA0172067.1 hypothetical protein FNF28_00384 [Cafeteria roenbergensis]
MIAKGEVFIGDRQVLSPALKVDPDTAVVKVGKHTVRGDGEGHAGAVASKLPRLVLVHKLPGELVTRSDPEGRPTLFGRLSAMSLGSGLKAVGRLDMQSEGLLLLTDDGGFSRFLEHPASRIKRVYRVRVFGEVSEWKLRQLRRGVTVGKETFRPMGVVVEGGQSRGAAAGARGRGNGGTARNGKSSGGLLAPRGNVWLRVTLSEGRNREIRRALASVQLRVGRLVRTGFGPYKLDGIHRGSAVEVRTPERIWQRARLWLQGKGKPSRAAESSNSGRERPAAAGLGGLAARTLPRATAEALSDSEWELGDGETALSGSEGWSGRESDLGGEEGEEGEEQHEDDEAGEEEWASIARETLAELQAELAERAGGGGSEDSSGRA